MSDFAVLGAALAMTIGLTSPPGPPPASAGPSRVEIRLTSGGRERIAHAAVPSGYDAGRAWPLVLVFHGAGGSGDRALDDNGWAAEAEREGFLAVAPDGLPARPHRPAQFLLNPRLWNDGQLREGTPRTEVDDVGFVRELIEEAGRRWRIDPARVFAAGHSNGAGMTFRLGAELSDRLAAIAPVAGHCWVASPRPAKPLPTLYIVGTADPLIKVEGGEMTTPWGRKTNPSVARTLDAWAAALGLAGMPPRTISDEGGVKRIVYGKEGAAVFLEAVFVEGQGHPWPGGRESYLPERFIGPRTDRLDATKAIWAFFRAVSERTGSE